MQKRRIEIGGEYGLREPPRPGVPLQRVKVLELVRSSRWRVEWIEPNPGLVDFVLSPSIVVPWEQRASFLRDEESHERLLRDSKQHWPGHDHPLSGAVDTVLQSTGEVIRSDNRGIFSCAPDVLERLAMRAGIGVPTLGYLDRHGVHHFPFSAALDLARSFAAAEPATVLLQADIEQRIENAEARDPGNACILPVLNRHRADRALVRQWAGHDTELALRDAEIERLRTLIRRSVSELQSATCDPRSLAHRLARGLGGG